MSSETARRLNEVLSALLARRLELSLAQVEQAIAAWRAGEHDAAAAHAETLRHSARASTLGTRIARAGLEGPATLLRDAYDLGIIDAAEFEKLAGVPVADVPAAPPLDEEAAAGPSGAMPKKRDVVTKLLEDGPVLVHLDARRSGVDVPDQHRHEAKLVLRIGYGLTPAIPDLEIDEQGIRATLTFRGRPHHCRIPWVAVYAVVAEDGRGLVWPEHVPPEVQAEFAGEGGEESGASGGGASGERPEPEPPAPGAGPGGAGGPKDRPRGRGHLRLV
jgi:stringent starvation protein B